MGYHVGLTARQEAFCVHYFVMKNATQAALRAGYSPKTAQEIGSETLCKPMIQARLRELQLAAVPAADVAVAVVRERLELLTHVARHEIETPVTAGHRVAAIAEMSKLGGDYPPERRLIAGEVILRIVWDADVEVPTTRDSVEGKVKELPPSEEKGGL